jgi:Predicted transcription factor, homolog of eukaryotic MBF1
MRVFGQVLKNAREAKFKSAQQFAEQLGLEPHTYRKYERGEAEPNFETLTRICQELGITPNDLLPAAGSNPRAAQVVSAA